MKPSFTHILIIIAVAIIIFGAPRLPGVARSVGQSLRIFKSEVRQMKKEDEQIKKGTDSDFDAETIEVEPDVIEHEDIVVEDETRQSR